MERHTSLIEQYGRLKRALNTQFAANLKELGVGPKQASILYHLHEKGEASLAELSRLTSSDATSTGRAADVLLKKGSLKQTEHPTDRRRWVVSLTPDGKKLAKRLATIIEKIESNLTEPLTGQELKQLNALLEKVLGPFSDKSLRENEESL